MSTGKPALSRPSPVTPIRRCKLRLPAAPKLISHVRARRREAGALASPAGRGSQQEVVYVLRIPAHEAHRMASRVHRETSKFQCIQSMVVRNAS
jgi:hypothetical protein